MKRKHPESDSAVTEHLRPSLIMTARSPPAIGQLRQTFTQLLLTDQRADQIFTRLTDHRRLLTANQRDRQRLVSIIAAVRAMNESFQTTGCYVGRWTSNDGSNVPWVTQAQIQELPMYQEKVAYLEAAAEKLKSSILKDTTELGIAKAELKKMRFWGAGIDLTDLPHELLVEVLNQLGWLHQQRLVRVCKLWLNTITYELDHIYLDAAALYESKINEFGLLVLSTIKYNRYHSVVEGFIPVQQLHFDPDITHKLPWKYHRSLVKQLTFNGQHVAQFRRASCDVVTCLRYRFPDLLRLNLVHMVMDVDWLAYPQHPDYKHPLQDYLEPQPSGSRSVLLKGSCIPALPGGLIQNDPRSKVLPVAEQGVFGGRYVRIPDVVWCSSPEFAGYCQGILPSMTLAWPYPEPQLQWLAKWASCLNADGRLLKLLWGFMKRDRAWDWRKPIMCGKHMKFCDHLGISFYNEMDGQMRNLIAAYVLKMPGTDQPPFSFLFERFHFRQGQSAKFALDY